MDNGDIMHGLEILKALNRDPRLASKGLDCRFHLPRPSNWQAKAPLAEPASREAKGTLNPLREQADEVPEDKRVVPLRDRGLDLGNVGQLG